jgi:hypothetical protein
VYIGKTPIVGNFQKCDAITVVNGQAAYTLQVSSTNVSPESANHMLVSLNGILQAPTTSFTVSGSTLTFASNLATGDVIDFVMLLGNVLDLGVPSDSTVSLAKLTATGTKSSSTFLRGDNTFAAVSSDYVKIAEVNTETDATNVDITLDVSTYDAFRLYWWSKPASDGYSIRARWIKNSSVQTGSDYNSGHFGTTSTNNYYSNVGENQDHFRLNNNAGNEASQGHQFDAIITPRKAADVELFGNTINWFAIRTDSSNNFRPIYGGAWYNGSDYEPDAIRIYMESGDFSSYAYKLYGIK